MDEENNEEEFALNMTLMMGCGCGIILLALGLIAAAVAAFVVPFMFERGVSLTEGPEGLVPAGEVVFVGEGAADKDVELLFNNEVVGATTADADGAWTLAVPATAAGAYLATARYAGDDMLPEEGISFQIPQPITADGLPQLGDGSAGESGATLIPFSWSGTGEPGTAVILRDNALGEFGAADIDADGNWTFSDAIIAQPGDVEFSARNLTSGDPALELGQIDPVALTIPAIGADGLPYFFSIGSIDVGETTLDPVTIEGQANPEAVVQIAVEEAPISDVVADSGGAWRFSGFIPSGVGTITASPVDSNGDVVFTGEPIVIDPVAVGTGLTNSSADTGLLKILFADPTADSGDSDFLAGSPAVELIVDASWSMTLPLDSNEEEDRLTADDPDSRIAVAKEALFDLVDNSLPTGAPVAVRAFGNIEGDLSCRTDLMLELQPNDKAELRDVIDGIEPQFNANTAIAASLAEVASDLEETDRNKVVVLLTDGAETCEGDPGAEIENLVAMDVDTRVNIIGFAIADDELRGQFEEWAIAGNGQYFDAADSDALVSALRRAMTVVYRVTEIGGDVVASGIVGGQEIELEPGLYNIELSSGSARTFESVIVLPGSAIELAVDR